MPRRKFAWLTPDEFLEGDYVCHPLLIPRPFVPAVMGAIYELTQAYNWEQHGAMTAEQATELMSAMLLEANENECGMATMDVRQNPLNPCLLEKQIAPDTWEIFATISDCGEDDLFQRYNDETGEFETSADGVNWDTARNRDPRFVGPRIELDASADCDDAKAIVGYLQYASDLVLDHIELGSALVVVAAALASALAIVFSAGTLAGPGLALISAISGLGSATVRAALTNEIWTDLMCLIHCTIAGHDTISDADFDAIRTGLGDIATGTAHTVLWNAINLLGPVGLQNVIAYETTATGLPADCSNCDCEAPWSECSFNGLGQRIWVESETRVWSNFAKIAGSYDALNDRYDGSLQGIASTTRFHGTTLEINFSPQIITHVDATGWASHTTNTATVLYHIALLRNGAVVASAGLTGTGTKQVVWNGSVEADEIVVTVRAGRLNQSPTSFISEICVEGNGINPFV